MAEPDRELGVRTFRIATGAHLLSFHGDNSEPSLQEALVRVPHAADIVVNVDGLGEDDVLGVIASLKASPRVRQSPRPVIVVCGKARLRRLFELSGLGCLVMIRDSLDDTFPYIVGRTWLTALTGNSR
jgi:hypothetical protein